MAMTLFKRFSKVVVLALVYVLAHISTLPAAADTASPIQMGTPFTNGAVLQQEMPVPVWGWSTPGAQVKVLFAGQTKTAVADGRGKWAVIFDPLKATAQPQSMVVEAAGKGLELSGILVGEVWVASGQSNMQWLASKCDVGRVLQAGIRERVEAGEEKLPIIREAKVTDYFSALHPIERAKGEWIDDGANMSGIAYAFAYELWKELQVPIGIVNCSFSSTAIEAWTPREGFVGSNDEYTRSIHEQLEITDPSTPAHKAAWSTYYAALEQAIKDNEQRVAKGGKPQPIDIKPPGNVNDNRAASWLYNARMHPMVPYAVRGAIWNQGYANSGAGLTYYPNLHSLVRGWRLMWRQPDLPVYFHQFYSAGKEGGTPPGVSFGSTSEMRLGTTMARDIPNTGMASQIDIGGSIHYYRKALPGQRLALHALKNQYGKDVIADGPFFESYQVKGNKLIVTFSNAAGGLFVGRVQTDNKLPATIVKVKDGETELGLFYLVGEDRVWHQATARIVGEKIELTAPGVSKPRGVSYGTPGVGFQPNLYNKASLPLTPFAVYDDETVIKANWPHDPPKVAGVEIDPNAGGLAYEYRKMPLLSTQFRDRAVLQHGKPVVIWGSAVHNWGIEHHESLVAGRDTVIKFSFGDIEKTIKPEPGMTEWSVTLDPMQPTDKPRTISARFYIGDELVHERVAENVVVGDVWYVAAADKINLPKVETANSVVRVIKRKAKRDRFSRPSRYSVAVSTTPKNRFASEWLDVEAQGFEGQLAHLLASEAGHPVGVIFMQNNSSAPLKSWIPFWSLKQAPSLADDFAALGTQYPGAPTYHDNIRRYIRDWQAYWAEYIPEMIETKSVPDGSAWGVIPKKAAADASSEATLSYNVMVHSFTPAALKGVIFIPSQQMLSEPHFKAQWGVLEQSLKQGFGGSPGVYLTTGTEDGKAIWGGNDPAK